MAEYAKPWRSVDEQIDRLARHGVEIGDRDRAGVVLQAVGYYRLTGYLYPFRESAADIDDGGRVRIRVLSDYRAGTTLRHAEDLIDLDRRLRLLVLDGVERIEVALRMRVGYVLGRRSPFAYEDPACFTDAFTAEIAEGAEALSSAPSQHARWLRRVNERKNRSDEQFIEHFREKYDDRMPIWALTEVLELGHLSTLYRGMRQQDAEEIALAFGVPTKKIMTSWLASLNYVRNVAAHPSRLFNRKLQNAQARPRAGLIPVMDHLRSDETAKVVFGTYSALAVIEYLVSSIDPGSGWSRRTAVLLREFPGSHALTIQSMGVPEDWELFDLWRSRLDSSTKAQGSTSGCTFPEARQAGKAISGRRPIGRVREISRLSEGAGSQGAMEINPSLPKQPSSTNDLVSRSQVNSELGKREHASHRIRRVRVRGLIMDLPGSDAPVEVCVHDQADWETIYKNRAIHVKCIIPSCDTLLMAKRMSGSGLRFFAVRSGGCDHNLTAMRVGFDEVEQEPASLVDGGGPEGVEHLWIKGRLHRIASERLGEDAVVEHSLTRGDVFLPKSKCVLEYQRWNTDFAARTLQRTAAGAARTIWLFPSQLPKGSPRSLRSQFEREVFQNGGIYVSVLNPRHKFAHQRPWEDPSQERGTFLFASGSIAKFDPDRRALLRGRLSLATVLAEILSGERVLQQVPIESKQHRRLERAKVWVLKGDLELLSLEQQGVAQGRQQAGSPTVSSPDPATELSPEPRAESDARSERESAAVPQDPRSRSEVLPPAVSTGHTHLVNKHASASTNAVPITEPSSSSSDDAAATAVQNAANLDVTAERASSGRSWWKRIAGWFRQT